MILIYSVQRRAKFTLESFNIYKQKYQYNLFAARAFLVQLYRHTCRRRIRSKNQESCTGLNTTSPYDPPLSSLFQRKLRMKVMLQVAY